MPKRNLADLTDGNILDAFRGIASDLAEASHQAGEKARIHLDDAADATFCALHVEYDKKNTYRLSSDFERIKSVLRKAFIGKRGMYINL